MAQTIIGLFDDFTTANMVVKELTAAGIPRENINVTANQDSSSAGTTGSAKSTTANTGGAVSNFFSSLFGSDGREEADMYTQAVQRGAAAVAVDTDEANFDRVAQIMDRHGAVDIDERTAQYSASNSTSQTSGTTPAARGRTEGEMAIPVVEEQLRVGKRAVQRGGVRIINRVTERPIEEHVNLREEHVNVERRPVNRAVSDADVANMKEGVIEISEMAEEAVVAKEARVVGEVVVNKETVERNETIRDTVRRTDVEVEELGTERETGTDRARGKSTT